MRENGGKPESGRTIFSELTDILEVAVDLTASLSKDPVLNRLIEAFRLMPLDDRDIIVGAIEREVRARRVSRATEDATGQRMHANRNARLYVRAHETPVLRKNIDRDDLMISMLRAMRVVTFLQDPEVHDVWVEGTREALAHLDASECTTVIEVLQKLLTLAQETAAMNAPKRAVRAS